MPKFGKKIILTSTSFAILANFLIVNPSISSANIKPINLKEAVKILGFENNNKDFKFSKKTIDKKQAVFNDITLGDDFKAAKLIVSLSPEDNNITLDFVDADLSTPDNKIFAKSGTIHFDEDIRNKTDKKLFQNTITKAKDAKFKGDIKFEGLNIVGKNTDISLKFGAVFVNDAVFENDFSRFGNAGFENFEMPVKSMMFKMAKFEVANLSDGVFKHLNKKDDETHNKGGLSKGVDFLKDFGVGKLQFSKIDIRPIAEMKNIATGSFTIDNFEINDFDNKHIGRFAIDKVNANINLKGEEGIYKFDELSFTNFKFDFIKYIISSYLIPKDSEEYKNTYNKSLFEFFKGGPLDGAIEHYKFKGFLISGFGGKISLDELSINTKKDENQIVTEFATPNGEFALQVTDKNKPFGKILQQGLDRMGLKEIIINYGLLAQYSPNEDNVNYKTAFLRFKDFGEITYNGVLHGQMGWLKKTTLGQMNDLMRDTGALDEIKSPNKKPELPKFKPDTFENYVKFYDGIKIKKSSFALHDLGGVNRIALQEALKQGKSAKEIKAEWAKELYAISGDRSKSLLIRDLANGFGRYITDGGKYIISTNDDNGISFNDLSDKNKPYKDLGITIQNVK